MNPTSRIFVAGGDTLIGAALCEQIQTHKVGRLIGERCEPDLLDPFQVAAFFARTRPEFVFLTAGKTGGIETNRTRPADLMRDNLLSAAHVIHAAHLYGVKKLLYLASSCSYPREAAQPMAVGSLMSGPLEPTNSPYALAKLAGWQLCSAYRQQHGCCFVTAIPANSFGPGDDFSPEGGHVIPGLLCRAHEARESGDKELVVWGTGTPKREFIYARDLAEACIFTMRYYDGPDPINLGGGTELSIADTAQAVIETVGFSGRLRFDSSRPDGMPLKALDARPIQALGWRPRTPFRAALAETYDWFLHHGAKEGQHHDSLSLSVSVPYSPSRGGGGEGLSDRPYQESGSPLDWSGSGLRRSM